MATLKTGSVVSYYGSGTDYKLKRRYSSELSTLGTPGAGGVFGHLLLRAAVKVADTTQEPRWHAHHGGRCEWSVMISRFCANDLVNPWRCRDTCNLMEP